jgi:hypothetical protein
LCRVSESFKTVRGVAVKDKFDSCGESLRDGHSVILVSNVVALLSKTFWTNAETTCGELTEVLESGKPSLVFCWTCAQKNKIVFQTEEEYSNEETNYQNCKLKW